MRIFRRWASPALMLLVLGCASSGGTSPSSPAGTLTQADLVATREADLYAAIQRLRPQWLRARGTNFTGSSGFAQVYVNGSERGDLQVLRQIPLLDVADVRFLSASDAATRYGTRAGTDGVILVRTR